MSPRWGVVTLVLLTLIWGTTFAIVKDALASIAVPLLLALRFSLAALSLVWVRFDRRSIRPAIILGLLAFTGFATQTLGLSLTGASQAAFITGLSVILTPLVSRLWLRRKLALRVYLAAFLALVGLGFMTLTGLEGVNRGDLWVLGTALAYAFYIVYLGEVAPKHPPLALSSLQLWPMAILAWLWAWPHLSELASVPAQTYLAVLYLAFAATALVTVLQTFAQRVVSAHVAALVFVLEPVFAALFAYLLLGETLGPWSWLGGGLILGAMLLSEVKGGGREPSENPLEAVQTE